MLIALLSLAALGVFVGTDLMHSREGKWLSIEQMSAPGTVDGRDVSTNGRLPYSLPACDGSGVLLLGDYASVEDVGKATTTTLGATYTTSRACGSLGGNSDTPEYFVVYLPVLGGRDDLCQALKNTRERLDTSVRATLLDDEPHTSESLCPRVAG
ncbi:hypothetical protein [Corynebacterium pygosceleis]|uniref:Uncharacterized protein n=1 Tax=Corynebacterium pygosceleis TaxID=2800406 RepID=A0A9Q4C8D6_9CORY|nr:hypothetical protein [Corynebacterium pygosceleis]MCK7638093.1 hypothetical protein [Corynebacterium pygosceleis]MCK7675807.1 hypothetical protein [Corynebacterium pygosceleis]MCL0120811.1 hypothetical protein [Corynebacterium pygosceleis]MCX7444352.1 hypothetical protein [Corynebacterium pygosceleis]MCX7468809.1 hypothetical protein [Corynebacterium pygosceleis]